MKKNTINLSLLTLLSVAIAALPFSAIAKDTNAPAAEKKAMKEPGAKKSAVVPIHGKLKALDKVAKTITIGEHTLQITSETMISKSEKPATLEDGVVGEEVSATYKKSDDGKFVAAKVRFGAKPEKAAKETTKKEAAKKD